MNLATVRFPSASLGRQVTYHALLPDTSHGDGPFPLVVQLHGASDDGTAWLTHANLARHVAALPLIVVLPEGGLSLWRNATPNERYEDYVVDDLLAHVRRTFPVQAGAAAVGGLSMGGFGAVYLGLRHPERFASVWAHSGAFQGALSPGAFGWPDGGTLLGELEAAARALGEGRAPVLSFDCGRQDPLLGASRALDAMLTGVGIAHLYREHPGAHTWDYWDRHVPEALAQHARVLAVAVP